MPTHTKPCAQCGNELRKNPKYSQTQWSRARYCSRTCQWAAKRHERKLCACGCGERVAKPESVYRPGHNPRPNRKVWRRHTIRGKARWYVSCRGGGCEPWARVVMRNVLGRELRPGEVVHHVNGDSEDDRPENLRVFASHAAHMRHEYEQGRLAVGRGNEWSCR